jgi:DNA polymerase elongation subunit (family B)
LSVFYTHVAVRGDDVLYIGYDKGQRVRKRVKYRPYVFVPAKSTTQYHSLDGTPVEKFDFECIRDARDFVRSASTTEGQDVYGLDNWENLYIYDTFPDDIEGNAELVNVANLDIEVAKRKDGGWATVEEADQPVTATTLKIDGTVHAFGLGDFEPEDPLDQYYKCESEEEMLHFFLQEWTRAYPDVMTGWNIDMFDVPYLVNRIKKLLGEEAAKRLSPWKRLEEKKITIRGRETTIFVPLGVTSLDYYRLYRNKKLVVETQESYTLDHIAHKVLKEKKLDYSEHASLMDLYEKDFPKFMRYNIRDVKLVDKLEETLGLIKLVVSIAWRSKVNFEDVLGSVKQWEVLCHTYLRKRNQVLPPKQDAGREFLLGGYVKEPLKGKHEWVVNFDLDSLYSHLIMQYNISPETFVGKLHQVDDPESMVEKVLAGHLDDYRNEINASDVAVAANLCCYTRKKKGFFPQILEEMYRERVENKRLMSVAKKELIAKGMKAEDASKHPTVAIYYNAQMSGKINLNSAYGCLSNIYFRFFSHDNAEAITTSARLAIRWIEEKINKYMNDLLSTEGVDYVIASDTDSIYIAMGALVKRLFPNGAPKDEIIDFLDQAVEAKISPFIEQSYQEMSVYTNALEQKMRMKREHIADAGFWTAKKHYALNSWDKEGVRLKTPELEVKGLEVVRSSTPQVSRDKLKDAITILASGTEEELQTLVSKFRKEFCTLPFDQVAFPRSVNGIQDYSDSRGEPLPGCPIQVRGALAYNRLLKEKGVTQFQPLFEGDKGKFANLIHPNPAHCHVITTAGMLPKELGLDEYVDKDMQFEKSFLEPLRKLTNAIGWSTERTIESFFE